jgi:hypothetical protein
MEILESDLENRLSKRYLALKGIEYYIEESVYYRSFSDDINFSKRKVLYNSLEKEGKLKLQ